MIIFVILVSYLVMVGIVGGGGLGDVVICYGFYCYDIIIMVVIVVMLIVLV